MTRIIRSKELKEQEKANPLPFSQIENEAKNIIDNAKKESALIIEKTKNYLVRIKEEIEKKSYAEGFEKGYKEGQTKGYNDGFEFAKQSFLKESNFLINDLKNVIAELSKEKMSLSYNIYKDLLKLALTIAEKIVKHEIKIDPSVFQANITKAIELTARRTELEIRVNPDDAKLIDDILPEIKKSITDIEIVKIVEDESIHRGGGVVITKEGLVDADVNTQLNEIGRILGI